MNKRTNAEIIVTDLIKSHGIADKTGRKNILQQVNDRKSWINALSKSLMLKSATAAILLNIFLEGEECLDSRGHGRGFTDTNLIRIVLKKIKTTHVRSLDKQLLLNVAQKLSNEKIRQAAEAKLVELIQLQSKPKTETEAEK
ncbi:hypothetical protein ACFL2R_02005 [Patescibacteria group bacterium]